MGYTKAIPWQDVEELLEDICKTSGMTLKQMREEHPGGFWYSPKRNKAYETEGFKTPSGKAEIYSERLEKMGIPPLPMPYEEPAISPITKPELFKEYPLMCIAAARVEEYEHTNGRNIYSLRRRMPDPLVQINPSDAAASGIENGMICAIESPHGEAIMKASLTEDVPAGIIAAPHGWAGAQNINEIISDEVYGPYVGAVQMRGIPCRLKCIS
jgi:anaerobic selenocysteine-containing dehydrogenase